MDSGRPTGGDELASWSRLALSIDPEEQRELVRRYRAGDASALDTLLRALIRWVIKIAWRYGRANHAERFIADLVQEGTRGVLDAAKKYDPDREAGANFMTYATWWIRHYIAVFLAAHAADVRLPIGRRQKLAKLVRRLEHHCGRVEDAGFTRGEVALLRDPSSRIRTVSLSDPVGHEDDGRTWADVLPEAGKHDVIDRLGAAKEARITLAVIRRMLGDRTAAFVAAHFGIGEDHALIYEEIARRYGVTRRCVHQEIARALGSPRIRRAVAAALGIRSPEDHQKFSLS